MLARFDIEIFGDPRDIEDQDKYVIHGYNETISTNDLNKAMEFLKESIKKYENDYKVK